MSELFSLGLPPTTDSVACELESSTPCIKTGAPVAVSSDKGRIPSTNRDCVAAVSLKM